MVGADDNQELAHEPIQHGEAKGRKGHDQEKRAVDGQGSGEAAKLADQSRVTALVEQANKNEKSAGRNAVAEHLVDGAFHSLRC